jgi:hypothetical protein
MEGNGMAKFEPTEFDSFFPSLGRNYYDALAGFVNWWDKMYANMGIGFSDEEEEDIDRLEVMVQEARALLNGES